MNPFWRAYFSNGLVKNHQLDNIGDKMGHDKWSIPWGQKWQRLIYSHECTALCRNLCNHQTTTSTFFRNTPSRREIDCFISSIQHMLGGRSDGKERMGIETSPYLHGFPRVFPFSWWRLLFVAIFAKLHPKCLNWLPHSLRSLGWLKTLSQAAGWMCTGKHLPHLEKVATKAADSKEIPFF